MLITDRLVIDRVGASQLVAQPWGQTRAFIHGGRPGCHGIDEQPSRRAP